MADAMVERAQRFVNSYNVPGIPKIEVTGRTGWTVMHALTRALQYELGLTELSDGFGPAPWPACRPGSRSSTATPGTATSAASSSPPCTARGTTAGRSTASTTRGCPPRSPS
ncbi:hypothetical protein [Actinomadura keratinilytica]|uniref:hypothetical protein n=1 Tax=Actinomadura keratinilytica TaxID=547461 RepID=UPI0036139AE5